MPIEEQNGKRAALLVTLRNLVGAIYDGRNDYETDNYYEGQYEREIQAFVHAVLNMEGD